MRSIRGRLILWLLLGLGVLWCVAALGVYGSVRQGLLKSVDAELAIEARRVRFAARGSGEVAEVRGRSGRTREEMSVFRETGGDWFYQVWNGRGESLEKSTSLGEAQMPTPERTPSADQFDSVALSDGRTVRRMLFRVSVPQGKGPGKGKGRNGGNSVTMALSKDIEDIERTLSSLAGGLVLVGLVAALVTGGMVTLIVRKGLKPLDRLTRSTREIDASNLGARVGTRSVPPELQPVYDALNELLERLERGFERERRFSSNLAHELRTPVAELKMLNEVALKWPDESDAETHEESIRIAGRLQEMIEALLMLARWESGETRLSPEAIWMDEWIADCWKDYRLSTEERGVGFELVTEPELAWETDPTVLRIVVSNLLSNAAEYTPDGGRIEVRATEQEISIANDAPDFNPDGLEAMFERFWRADEARSPSSHSGVGLSIARQGAEALGLCLTADYEEPMLRFVLKKS